MLFSDDNYRGKVALVVGCLGHEAAAALEGCGYVRKTGEVELMGALLKRRTEKLADVVFNAVFFNFAA